MFSQSRSRIVVFLLLAMVLTLAAVSAVTADSGPQTVLSYESLGIVTFPTGYMFSDTEVGGLSGITYDAKEGVYYALSDDRGDEPPDFVPSRYYTVDIDLSDGSLDPGDVTFLDVTTILDKQGQPFAPRAVDPEGIDWVNPGQLYISSEGGANATPPINPFVSRFNPNAKQTQLLAVPGKFLPDGTGNVGIRNNLAFETLVSSPDKMYVYTAVENALAQDGPRSTLVDHSPARVLQFDRETGEATAEWVYMVAPIPKAPIPPTQFADNGLVDMRVLDNHGTFLAMERSFAVGVGNTIRVFEISNVGATDVSGYDSLMGMAYTPMSKQSIFDLEDDLGLDPDNIEGMTFGPPMADGRIPLILVSDNNFNPSQTTQFIVIALEIGPAP